MIELTEKAWDAQLFASRKGLAPMLGWSLTYHTLRSKGSTSGFPDRVLVRERVIFAELKTDTGRPTERQIAWLDGLHKAGAEVYLWRPRDLDEIGKILGPRFQYGRNDHRSPVGLHSPFHGLWQPLCTWVGGQTRRELYRKLAERDPNYRTYLDSVEAREARVRAGLPEPPPAEASKELFV